MTIVKEKKEKQQKSVFFRTTFPDGRVELTEKIWLLLNGEKTLVRVTSGSIANDKKDGIWETAKGPELPKEEFEKFIVKTSSEKEKRAMFPSLGLFTSS